MIAYLDHNSSTSCLPEALAVMAHVARLPHNPSAPHAIGREAAAIVDDARRAARGAFGLGREWDVVFTATGTEANNIAIRGFPGFVQVISAVEHKSIAKAIDPQAIILPVDGNGIVDMSFLCDLLPKLTGQSAIFSIMGCNNETGIIQPLDQIINIIRQYSPKMANLVIHSDMVQMAGRLAIDVQGLDMFTISGHKLGAPMGVAALLYRRKPCCITYGGGQEHNVRPGTQNVPAIAALGFVLREKLPWLKEQMQRAALLRDTMEQTIGAHSIIVGHNVPRVPNTSCIITPGIDKRLQLIKLDMNNICVGFGSSCAAGGDEPSETLLAMGYSYELESCAIRISMGWNTRDDDISRLLDVWKSTIDRRS